MLLSKTTKKVEKFLLVGLCTDVILSSSVSCKFLLNAFFKSLLNAVESLVTLFLFFFLIQRRDVAVLLISNVSRRSRLHHGRFLPPRNYTEIWGVFDSGQKTSAEPARSNSPCLISFGL
jgi:hypothetical protein